MNRLDALTTIADQAGRGELTFPTNLNASLKIQQALDDPDCHIEAAAKLVMAEPLLSARTVADANSVAYNQSGAEISNVRSAVARLGFRTLRSLAATVVVRQFGSKLSDPALRARLRNSGNTRHTWPRAASRISTPKQQCLPVSCMKSADFTCCLAPLSSRACSMATRMTGWNSEKWKSAGPY
jgi:hypothetical protein